MDLPSALSVACSAAKLVEVSLKLAGLASEIHTSKSLSEKRDQLLLESQGVERMIIQIQSSLSIYEQNRATLALDQQTTLQLATGALEASGGLRDALDKFRKQNVGTFRAAKVLISSFDKRNEIQKAQDRLHHYQEILWTQMLFSFVYQLEVDKFSRTKKAEYEDLIKSLRVPDLGARYGCIKEVAEHTYDWIFQDAQPSNSGITKFHRFLRDPSERLFWISGRDGAGKSALMKALAEDIRFKAELCKWAEPHQPLILSSFLSKAGSLQRGSFEGLLRTMLLHFLGANPKNAETVMSHGRGSMPFWSCRGLEAAFFALVTQSTADRRILFMIDGLDDFIGDSNERNSMIKFLERLASFEHVKLCLSSRPETHIKKAFGQANELIVQEHTRDSMLAYARSRLTKNTRYAEAEAEGPERMQKLPEVMVDKAEGSYRWLSDATCNVVEGLYCRDEIDMLYDRLKYITNRSEEL